MARSVKPWTPTSDDAAIPKAVRLRVFARCNGRCALTGRKLLVGDPFDLDHITPLSMGGTHTESNLQVVYRPAHREKTAAEAGPRAKADRIRLKHIGAWPKSTRPIQGRGFSKRGMG